MAISFVSSSVNLFQDLFIYSFQRKPIQETLLYTECPVTIHPPPQISFYTTHSYQTRFDTYCRSNLKYVLT